MLNMDNIKFECTITINHYFTNTRRMQLSSVNISMSFVLKPVEEDMKDDVAKGGE